MIYLGCKINKKNKKYDIFYTKMLHMRKILITFAV